MKFSDYLERVEFSTHFLWSLMRVALELLLIFNGVDDTAIIAVSSLLILEVIFITSRIIKMVKSFHHFNEKLKRKEERQERILRENSIKNSRQWNSFFKKGGEL